VQHSSQIIITDKHPVFKDWMHFPSPNQQCQSTEGKSFKFALLKNFVISVSECAVQVPSHSAVFINEPRLSEFKQIVVSKGIQAEMSGGVLICNNVVAVRRVRRTTVVFGIQQWC